MLLRLQNTDVDAAVTASYRYCKNLEDPFTNDQELAVNSISQLNRCPSPLSTASHISSDCSSDMDSSSSSVVVRRRPAKPRIDLLSASLSEIIPKEDDFLLLQTKDLVFTSEKYAGLAQSGHVENGRPGSADSSTSYLNVVDDHMTSKYSDEDQVDAKNKEYSQDVGPRKNSYAVEPTNKTYEEFRSNSPTSCLLRPLFQHAMSAEIYQAIQLIRSELSPKMGRLQNLESDAKLLPVLQVKLAVLREEKRQLMSIVKQKRSTKYSTSSYLSSTNSSPIQSRGSSPTSFISDAEEPSLLRPLPRRAIFSKETQTDDTEPLFKWLICPYCQTKTMDSMQRICGQDNKLENEVVSLSRHVFEEKIEIAVSDVALCEMPGSQRSADQRISSDTGAQNDVDVCATATSPVNNVSKHNGVGRVAPSVSSVGTETMEVLPSVNGVGTTTASVADRGVLPSVKNASTETTAKAFVHKAVGEDDFKRLFSDLGIQKNVDAIDGSSQVPKARYSDKSLMVGCTSSASIGLQSSPKMLDASFGDEIAAKTFRDSETQEIVHAHDKEAQCSYVTADKSITCGCGFLDRQSIGVGVSVSQSDFECGDGVAEIGTSDFATQICVETSDVSLSPVETERNDVASHCNLDSKETVSAGFGEHTVNDLLCDSCLNKELVSTGVGSYNNGCMENVVCKTDDKLCDCRTLELSDTAVGDASVDEVVCDVCKKETSRSVACGDDRTDSLPCDKCDNVVVATTGCGDDDVNTLLCGRCADASNMVDRGVGETDAFEVSCDNCANASTLKTTVDPETTSQIEDSSMSYPENGEGDNSICEEVYKIMAHASIAPDVNRIPVICNYCGNKVDINDPNLDKDLDEMRNNLSSYRVDRLDVADGMMDLAASDDAADSIDDDEDEELVDEEEEDADGYDER